jgi:uncharacterized Fe-S cluster protein YjdI
LLRRVPLLLDGLKGGNCTSLAPTLLQWSKQQGVEDSAPTQEAPMQEYKNDKLVVRYDPAICIHAAECVRGLPSVFNVSKKPWIDVNGASPAAIIEQVKLCPSGALTYEVLKDAL